MNLQFVIKQIVVLVSSLVLISTAVQKAPAADFLSADGIDFQLFINDRFHFFSDFFDSGARKFDQDTTLHILFVNPRVSALLGPHVQGVFELESEFMYDFNDDDFEDDIDVRNAYLQAVIPGWDWALFSAGRLALRTVDGLIYDDEAPAFRLYADLERGFSWPLKFQAIATEVENDSPYIHAELTYAFSFLESVTVFYGWFRDTQDGIARIFNYYENERMYSSRGTIQWFGFSLRTFLGTMLLRTTCIYERGSVHLRHTELGRHSMDMRGYLLDFNADYNFTKNFSGTLFLYVSSGDGRPLKGAFRSFVSIDPYIDKTNIFFNGGIDSQFSSDNVGLNGIQLPGVMAPGLSCTYRWGNKALIKFTGAYLLTHTGTGGQGHTYGWEADLTAYYDIQNDLQAFMEFNLLKPGDYFRKLTDHREHTSTEVIIGISYYFNI